MKKNIIYSGLLSLVLLTAGCGSQDTTTEDNTTTEHHFSYDGTTGPSFWASMDPQWSTCANGLTYTPVEPGQKHQSPVDIESSATNASFTLDYDKDIEFKMENNGHTVEFVPEAGQPTAKVTIDGKDYFLKQFHFHSYSEHMENGKHADMEAHFVNVADDGSIAVIGIFIDKNATGTNAALNNAYALTIPEAGEENPNAIAINPAHILPTGKVYSYSGSLTTPPCSENVAWNIYETHVDLNATEVDEFRDIYSHNYRPVTGNL